MTEPLMSIGTFSRASSISIKALRAYHAQGILEPAIVDDETGFRNYHVGQLADAAVVRRLRDLDVPLAAIRDVLAARDPEVTRRVLTEHTARMRSELERAERIVSELSRTEPVHETPARIVQLAPQTVIAVSGVVSGDGFSSFLQQSYAALFARIETLGLRVAGPPAGLYAPEILDDTGEPATAYVPVEDAPTNVGEGLLRLELPAVTVAALTHRGGYDSIGERYEALGAWVAHHARPTGAPVREIYAVGPTETADPADYRTDICWPVELVS
ncbi:MerR family transcriptional regulator [Intrasporangium sp.]|uniref:MerR family transcriptional regulator n=1 Tax=Intrasporangium sp. TaxID=1925024 RepID=UPI0029397C63|nr:MerR family transcriptional regulator [Intrasporangium sp.]MDV3220528.1 MerR family transcriptional regulator [Intrasporangium sp.]